MDDQLSNSQEDFSDDEALIDEDKSTDELDSQEDLVSSPVPHASPSLVSLALAHSRDRLALNTIPIAKDESEDEETAFVTEINQINTTKGTTEESLSFIDHYRGQPIRKNRALINFILNNTFISTLLGWPRDLLDLLLLKPYLIIKRTIKCTWSVIKEVSVGIIDWIITRLIKCKPNKRQMLKQAMGNANNFEEWSHYATQLDQLEGNEEWKLTPRSRYYAHSMIQDRLVILQGTNPGPTSLKDNTDTMLLIRAGAIRNFGGICHPRLYTRCHVGTKQMILDYAMVTIDRVKAVSLCPALTKVELREFYGDLLQSLGRSALVLHGGATFAACHLGVIKALWLQGMLPRVILGSYIGALIAALVCVKSKTELDEFLRSDPCPQIDLSPFTTQYGSTWRRRLARFIQHGRLLDIKVLEEVARVNLGGDVTFLEAWQKNQGLLVLNIALHLENCRKQGSSIGSSTGGTLALLLNYLTAPDVVIWSAACAACATPGLYDQSPLLRKIPVGNKGDYELVPWYPCNTDNSKDIPATGAYFGASTVYYKTGAPRFTPSMHTTYPMHEQMEDDETLLTMAPIIRLTELFNVTNVIESRVPIYFNTSLDQGSGAVAQPHQSWLGSLLGFIGSEVVHMMHQARLLGIVPAPLQAIQRFLRPPVVGHVQIIPLVKPRDMLRMVSVPTKELLAYGIRKGEQAAWRHMTLVYVRCALEFELLKLLEKENLK